MRSPIDSRDHSDPGDQVIRKFRYQHAYGVVLAILMLNQTRPYRAIWCEQHEDLLAERTDDLFEAFQVKTRKPETGSWNITDESFVKSMKRFVDLDSSFLVRSPNSILSLILITRNSDAQRSAHLSPIKLSKAVLAAKSKNDLEGSALDGFEVLQSATEQDW